MASALLEESSVLQDELTCPVCLDVYRDPHLLPCGHNFCKICLDRLKRQAERGRFRCPECRDSHRCGTNFQKNFKLANIADDYRLRRRATVAAEKKSRGLLSSSLSAVQVRSLLITVPCDYCPSLEAQAFRAAAEDGSSAAALSQEGGDQQGGDQQEAGGASMFAVKTCLKCEVSMCQEHVKPHLELPAFRDHPLTEPMNDLWKRKCPDHDEIYRYYCLDDKMCVCNACTIEGGHSGHTIKTLKNTMKDLKGTLDKQLCRVEKKYSLAEKKLHEQKEKERLTKRFRDDSDQCLMRLGEDMKVRMLHFVYRLRDCTRSHCDANVPTIQKNISRICQDQARLQEVRCGIESLVQESDPFRFIEAYKTTGKQCRKQLRKNMFYPEYVDMETEVLGVMMDDEMRKFLEEELPAHIMAATHSIYLQDEAEEDNEEEAVEEEEEEEEEEDEDDDDLDDSSVEEMRSEGEVEEEDEEDDDEEGRDRSELADYLYSPEEDEEDEEEDDEDDEDDEDEDGEEDGEVRLQVSVLKQAPALCRASVHRPVCASENERQFKSMPTHGIGRWRHLLPKEAPKKKKDKHQMKEILAETDTAYGTLNVKVSGYDMTVVEHYSQYIHNLCNRLGIKVSESYVLPTKSTEVMLMPEQGTKMFVDAVLKTHERVVQLSSLNAASCPVFIDVLLKNQPEGVQLSVMEHTVADFQARFKGRPDLEGLIAQISN